MEYYILDGFTFSNLIRSVERRNLRFILMKKTKLSSSNSSASWIGADWALGQTRSDQSSVKLAMSNPFNSVSSANTNKAKNTDLTKQTLVKQAQPIKTKPKTSLKEMMADPKKRTALIYGVQAAFSLLAAIIVIILAVTIRPPLTQKTNGDNWAEGEIFWVVVIIWAVLAFGLSFGIAEGFRRIKIG